MIIFFKTLKRVGSFVGDLPAQSILPELFEIYNLLVNGE